MFRFSMPWLIAPIAAAAIAAVLIASPGPGQPPSLDGEPAIGPDPEVAAVRRQLDAKQEEVRRRIAYKEGLIDRLVDGQTGLGEATAEFLRLNRDNPPCLEVIRQTCPGSSDEEKTAYNVLEYVRVRPLSADQKARVLARLQRELEQRYGRYIGPAI